MISKAFVIDNKDITTDTNKRDSDTEVIKLNLLLCIPTSFVTYYTS